MAPVLSQLRRYRHRSRTGRWSAVAASLAVAMLMAPTPSPAAIICNIGPFQLPVTQDSMLRAGDRNTNEGANQILSIAGTGNTRIVLEFTNVGVFCSTKLVLAVADNPGNWGPGGKWISVHPLLSEFDEGNGQSWGLPRNQQAKGSGAGVTWSCPTDTNIANQTSNCAEEWAGGEIGPIIESVLVTNETTGPIIFDLSAYRLANIDATTFRFLIKKDNDGAPGRIDFHSKESPFTLVITPFLELF